VARERDYRTPDSNPHSPCHAVLLPSETKNAPKPMEHSANRPRLASGPLPRSSPNYLPEPVFSLHTVQHRRYNTKQLLGPYTMQDAITETKLLRAGLLGNKEAFATIVERYQSLICAITYSTTGDLAESRRLAKETFIRAWSSRTQISEPEPRQRE